jgi:HSP20 family protein
VIFMAEKKRGVRKPAGKKTDEQAEKIRMLEKKIEELEIEGRERGRAEEPSLVGGVVGQLIPGLGNIVKVLEQTSPEFRKKIADTDVEIKHRIETGWGGGGGTKPIADYGISFRPMKGGKGGPNRSKHVKVRSVPGESIKIPDKEPVIDVFEEKDHISVIAELPGVSEKDIKTSLQDHELKITAGKHNRMVSLPSAPGKVLEQTFKNGILHLKLAKKAA